MEEKTKLYKKWWFWVCIVIIVLSICFTLVVGIAIATIKSDNIQNLALQIQHEYENATVYSSAGEKTLVVELKYNATSMDDVDDAVTIGENCANAINIISKNIENLSTYETLIIYYSTNVGEDKDVSIAKIVFNMPSLEITELYTYIDTIYMTNSIFNSLSNLFNY